MNDQVEMIGVPTALELARKKGIHCVYATMIKWIKANNLGYQPLGEGSRWNVNKKLLEEFLENGPKK